MYMFIKKNNIFIFFILLTNIYYTLSWHFHYHIHRIIGNNIPCIHAKNQNIKNTKMIIKYERIQKETKYTYILNRIINKKKKKIIYEILTNNTKKRYTENITSFINIPFIQEEYKKISSNNILQKRYYVTNINAARNLAIEHTFKYYKNAKYAFPFDGNTFITTQGWNIILKYIQLTEKNPFPVFFIPMLRIYDVRILQDNILKINYKVDFNQSVIAEPQVAIHKNANIRFLEDKKYGYGNKNKIEFLQRAQKLCKEKKGQNCPCVGFVYHLPSGLKYNEAIDWNFRKILREQGMEQILKNLEHSVYPKEECFNKYKNRQNSTTHIKYDSQKFFQSFCHSSYN